MGILAACLRLAAVLARDRAELDRAALGTLMALTVETLTSLSPDTAWEVAAVEEGRHRALVLAVTLPARTLTRASPVMAVVMVVVADGAQPRMVAVELPLGRLAALLEEVAEAAEPSRILPVELVGVEERDG
jgi:hypothetical protein